MKCILNGSVIERQKMCGSYELDTNDVVQIYDPTIPMAEPFVRLKRLSKHTVELTINELAMKPDAVREYANCLDKKARQVLYNYLHDVLGCRR